jgi:hypothetical protein
MAGAMRRALFHSRQGSAACAEGAYHARAPHGALFYGRIMTSAERREGRYARRTLARDAKRREHAARYDDFSRVADLDSLYDAYRSCAKGVSWKESTQRYSARWMANIMEARRKLLSGEDVRSGFVCFTIFERGKKRNIRSVHISERVVQKALCDQTLVPLLERSLIYDNPASMRGKGTSFALRRLTAHLSKYFRKYGADGYALTVDFSKYFDSVPHDILLEKLGRYTRDSRVFSLARSFITAFGDGVSLGLGSQVSQICAVFFASSIDHLVKDRLAVKFYGRYMDDLYLIHRDKGFLKSCLAAIASESGKLGLAVNTQKTRIVSLRHGFVFLKGRYSLSPRGKVIKRPLRDSTAHTAKRLRTFALLVEAGKMDCRDVRDSYQSWRKTFRRRFHGYFRVLKMDALYNNLFINKGVSHGVHRCFKRGFVHRQKQGGAGRGGGPSGAGIIRQGVPRVARVGERRG